MAGGRCLQSSRFEVVPVLPKINSNGFGGKVIAVGILVGAVIPLILWVAMHRIIWPLVIVGAAIIVVFCALLAIEMRQDANSAPFLRKSLGDTVPYDPETQYPVIRASICTGERVAGFKNKVDGRFTEVMLLRSMEDEQTFKDAYGIKELKTEY